MKSFAGSRVLVTGGAGFIGSHLVDRLLADGAKVTVVDNFVTGRRQNLELSLEHKNFTLIEADCVKPPSTYLDSEGFDCVFHLASPASPVDFERYAQEIYSVNAFGTHYITQYVQETGGRLLFASTSESYGEPLEHPQKESYFGNVNPTGIRACYDESKRFGEMVVSTFIREHGLDGRIVRIFNTYGPRMRVDDGRAIPTFISQAIQGQPVTVHGDGSQTRSLCYVDDLVEFLIRAMLREQARGEVINIGNADEHCVLEIANQVIQQAESRSEVVFKDRPSDDPSRRKPDLSKASAMLDFSSAVSFSDGLARTIDYFRRALS